MRARISTLIGGAVFAAAAAAGGLQAQDAANPLIAELKMPPKVTTVQTPQFQVGNVPAKPFRPRNWMEIDVPFDLKKKAAPGDTSAFVDDVEFRFYIVLNKFDKAAPTKRLLLTGTLHCLNVPLKDKCHLLVFVSPTTLARTLEKPVFTDADVLDIGIEALAGGATIGAYSKLNKKWWDNLEAFSAISGSVLPKSKTPFAPLWGDYDVEVKQQ